MNVGRGGTGGAHQQRLVDSGRMFARLCTSSTRAERDSILNERASVAERERRATRTALSASPTHLGPAQLARRCHSGSLVRSHLGLRSTGTRMAPLGVLEELAQSPAACRPMSRSLSAATASRSQKSVSSSQQYRCPRKGLLTNLSIREIAAVPARGAPGRDPPVSHWHWQVYPASPVPP